MPRYIDAEKANKIMLNAMCGTGYQSRAMSAIDDTPTADVEEVKHGKWEEEQVECYGLPSTNYVCPECGAWFDGTFMAACMGGVEDEGILFPRCPSCGCVMDGKESGDGRTDTD